LRKYYSKYADDQLVTVKNAGFEGNLGSIKQVATYLYETLGVTPYRTPKGNYRLDGPSVIEILSNTTHPQVKVICEALLEYKASKQAVSLFLDNYIRCMYKENGVYIVHPNWNQVGTKTARLSCNDPNMMQVADSETGRRKSNIQTRPRQVFGPRDGTIWHLYDYSQIEVWLFSFISRETNMMKLLMSGYDFHGKGAELVWKNNSDYKENTPHYRKRFKIVMFSYLYGAGINGLARILRCPRDDAKLFKDQFDALYPGVGRFIQRTMQHVETHGFVENVYGRPYFVDEGFEYKATNYIIQGTAAEVQKNAMIYISEMMWKDYKLDAPIVLTVHDETAVEIPLELHSKELMHKIIKEMQRDSKTILGLPVDLNIGVKIAPFRWSETEKVTL
jgi:DNA polymerase-1